MSETTTYGPSLQAGADEPLGWIDSTIRVMRAQIENLEHRRSMVEAAYRYADDDSVSAALSSAAVFAAWAIESAAVALEIHAADTSVCDGCGVPFQWHRVGECNTTDTMEG